MRVLIYVDGIPAEITTRDPELLGRWLAEVFANIEFTPATMVEFRAYPGWTGQYADWIMDSRVITRQTPVRSPQEFVDALQAQIDEAASLGKV